MYFVYVLKSKNYRESYTGITDNIERRLIEHNNGKSFYTKRYIPWEVLYQEQHNTRENARKRERYFKSAAGRKWLRKNVFKN